MEDTVKIWGNVCKKDSSFITPYSLSVYEKNFFVVDRLSHRLYKYDLSGKGGNFDLSGEVKLKFPYDVIVRDDKIYVADSGNYRILVLDLKGELLNEIGGYGEKIDQFSNGGIFNGDGRSSNPQCIFLDNMNNIHAVDIFENCIKVFDGFGKFIEKYSFSKMTSYGIVEMDEYGNYYMTSPDENKVRAYDKNRQLIWEFGSFGTGPSQFQAPWRVKYHNDRIYVSDLYNHRMQIFDTNGKYIEEFGQWGLQNSDINYIFGFDFDRNDNLYLTDTWNHRIKILNNKFDTMTIFGSIDDEIVLRPSAVCIEPTNKLVVVCDYLNHCIKFIDTNGHVIRKIGNAGNGSLEFQYPNDVMIHEDKLYVSDSKNNRVQVISTEGVFLNEIRKNNGARMIPSSVAIYKNRLFVADIESSVIHEYDATSLEYKCVYMNRGNKSGEVQSDYKTAFIRLSVWENKLIISDASNNRIQVMNLDTNLIDNIYEEIVSPTRARMINEKYMLVCCRNEHKIAWINVNTKEVTYLQKGPGNKDDELIAPWDVTYHNDLGSLIIMDSLNNRIKKIDVEVGGIE